MPAYIVRVLGVAGFREGPQRLTITIEAPCYADAVCAVAQWLDDELIPYASFAGSRLLGR